MWYVNICFDILMIVFVNKCIIEFIAPFFFFWYLQLVTDNILSFWCFSMQLLLVFAQEIPALSKEVPSWIHIWAMEGSTQYTGEGRLHHRERLPQTHRGAWNGEQAEYSAHEGCLRKEIRGRRERDWGRECQKGWVALRKSCWIDCTAQFWPCL